MKPRLAGIFSGTVRRRVRFVTEGRRPGYRERWLLALHAFVPRLPAKIETWLAQGLGATPEFARQFTEAAGKDADGVTVIASFEQIAGLDAIGRAIRKEFRGGMNVDGFGPPQRTTIEVLAGARR